MSSVQPTMPYATAWTYSLTLLIALVYRAATGLHPYSGEGLAPMYGDYEAQRHWMELTRALPAREWYRQSQQNDLAYWGLDYPPLSAYASKVAAWYVGKMEYEAVELGSSRGYESPKSRAAMRATVLAADALILFPALIAFISAVQKREPEILRNGHAVLCFVLSLPALILIDHGHFQYNGVSLGLFIGCVASMATGWHPMGAILFCFSVYFKQMSLYYAPAIASYLLGTMVRTRPTTSSLTYAARIALSIAVATIVVFAPWLPSNIGHVVRRLFPVARGLYEDKVGNVWCTLSIVIKWNQVFSKPTLLTLCTFLTSLACMPFCIAVARTPSTRQLLISTAGCAMAAYLFSYQVHEKQILIPLMPIALLAELLPMTALWASLLASFSLYPLLNREGLAIAYIALTLLHVAVADAVLNLKLSTYSQKTCAWLIFVAAALLHAAKAVGPTIATKPDLYVLLMTSFACANFCALYIYLLYISASSLFTVAQPEKQHGA